jgi:hypothetical protein
MQKAPVFELLSFSPGWRVPTRLVVNQGSPLHSELFRPTVLAFRETALVWVSGGVSQSWQRARPCCSRRSWRSSSSEVTAPVYRGRPPGNRREATDCQTWLQELCRAVLRQLAVAGRCGYVVCIQTGGYRGTGRPWATAARMTRRVDVADWRAFGTFGGLGVMVRFSAARREAEDGQLVQEASDPHGVEGFSHVQENRAS